MTDSKLRIYVSDEMLSFVGQGEVSGADWPVDPVMVSFAGIDGESTPVLRFEPNPIDAAEEAAADVVLVVRREACRRLFGGMPPAAGCWFMPSALRALVISIRDCDADVAVRTVLHGARSIELLCQSFAEMERGELVPAEGCGQLTELDAARIAAARRLIDERWHEKLTLDGIARACGLNRDKLARGFRAIYHSTVADILVDKRLSGARQLLLATDLPVATIGYRCGYLNNASFTRAFTRRFGVAPTHMRQGAIAA